jgi:hypothetical protein
MSGELTSMALFSFWTHALAAACFASLLLWRLKAPIVGRDQALLLAAYLLTTAWQRWPRRSATWCGWSCSTGSPAPDARAMRPIAG